MRAKGGLWEGGCPSQIARHWVWPKWTRRECRLRWGRVEAGAFWGRSEGGALEVRRTLPVCSGLPLRMWKGHVSVQRMAGVEWGPKRTLAKGEQEVLLADRMVLGAWLRVPGCVCVLLVHNNFIIIE